MPKVKDLLKQLAIEPNDIGYYEQAFIHRSFVNESKGNVYDSNERLEFLGDAILELIVSEFLFKKYPRKREGRLTAMRAKIVQTTSLAKIGLKLKLNQYLHLSKGEHLAQGDKNRATLADTFEAFLGAIYQDQGLVACQKFLEDQLLGQVNQLLTDQAIIDYKSQFQEKIQAKQKVTPVYRVIKAWGPDHKRSFKVAAMVAGQEFSQGSGKSKQQAEQRAAKNALEKLK